MSQFIEFLKFFKLVNCIAFLYNFRSAVTSLRHDMRSLSLFLTVLTMLVTSVVTLSDLYASQLISGHLVRRINKNKKNKKNKNEKNEKVEEDEEK